MGNETFYWDGLILISAGQNGQVEATLDIITHGSFSNIKLEPLIRGYARNGQVSSAEKAVKRLLPFTFLHIRNANLSLG